MAIVEVTFPRLDSMVGAPSHPNPKPIASRHRSVCCSLLGGGSKESSEEIVHGGCGWSRHYLGKGSGVAESTW